MKRFFFLMMVCLLVGIPATAKKHVSDSQLVGVWQMCSVTFDNGRPVVNFLPFLKALNSDGTFTNMEMRQGPRFSMISTTGTWKISSDSVYVESIKRSVYDPGFDGKDNNLGFCFQGPDFLVLKYSDAHKTKFVEEYWVRVVLPEKVGMGSNLSRPTNIDLIKDAVKQQQQLMPGDD